MSWMRQIHREQTAKTSLPYICNSAYIYIYIISVNDTTTSYRCYRRDAYVVINRDRNVWVRTIRRGTIMAQFHFFFTRTRASSHPWEVSRCEGSPPNRFIVEAIILEDFRGDSHIKNSPSPPPPSSARFDVFEYLNPLLTTHAVSHVACEPFGARIV